MRHWLKAMMAQRGMTSTQLGADIGVSERLVSYWVTGTKEISPLHQIRLVKRLGREAADQIRNELVARAGVGA